MGLQDYIEVTAFQDGGEIKAFTWGKQIEIFDSWTKANWISLVCNFSEDDLDRKKR